ncbi:hypothetical protein BH10PSE19_BH10PSE19_10260 [soil metagenome]
MGVILDFYKSKPAGRHPTSWVNNDPRELQSYSGATLRQLHKDMEDEHTYVQRWFPLLKPSEAQPTTPFMQADEYAAFSNDPSCLHRLIDYTAVMLKFWGLELVSKSGQKPVVIMGPNFNERNSWLKNRDHNFHRVSRVIECLANMGLHDYAAAVYQGVTQAAQYKVQADARLPARAPNRLTQDGFTKAHTYWSYAKVAYLSQAPSTPRPVSSPSEVKRSHRVAPAEEGSFATTHHGGEVKVARFSTPGLSPARLFTPTVTPPIVPRSAHQERASAAIARAVQATYSEVITPPVAECGKLGTFKFAFRDHASAQAFFNRAKAFVSADDAVTYHAGSSYEKFPMGDHKYIVRFEFAPQALKYLQNELRCTDANALYGAIMGDQALATALNPSSIYRPGHM